MNELAVDKKKQLTQTNAERNSIVSDPDES